MDADSEIIYAIWCHDEKLNLVTNKRSSPVNVRIASSIRVGDTSPDPAKRMAALRGKTSRITSLVSRLGENGSMQCRCTDLVHSFFCRSPRAASISRTCHSGFYAAVTVRPLHVSRGTTRDTSGDRTVPRILLQRLSNVVLSGLAVGRPAEYRPPFPQSRNPRSSFRQLYIVFRSRNERQ